MQNAMGARKAEPDNRSWTKIFGVSYHVTFNDGARFLLPMRRCARVKLTPHRLHDLRPPRILNALKIDSLEPQTIAFKNSDSIL